MKIYNFLLLMIILILLQSCSSFKKELIQTGVNDIEVVLKNAILDFSHSRYYKKHTVFYVDFLELINHKKFLVVTISRNDQKILFSKNKEVDSQIGLPTRYLEKEGKLFFWWDDKYKLNKETFAIFNKYNLLQDDDDGLRLIASYTNYESLKSTHYFFCKNNLDKYKKVKTYRGIGYYDPPKLNCTN